MLKILGRPTSINVRKVRWLCAELGLPFDNEPWGSDGFDLKDPAFVARNPNAKVPVLVDDEFVLWESNAICRYLAAREARFDLLPASPAARARVEQWMDWQSTELNTAWRYAFMALVRRSAAHGDPVAVAASIDDWNQQMRVLDGQLAATGAFVTGDAFTLADLVLGVATHRWSKSPIARAELPTVERWFDRLQARPAFAAERAGWGDAP